MPKPDPAEVDTVEIPAITDGASLEATHPLADPGGGDPYNRTGPAQPMGDTVKRRTLDDMRRLSDEIKHDRKD